MGLTGVADELTPTTWEGEGKAVESTDDALGCAVEEGAGVVVQVVGPGAFGEIAGDSAGRIVKAGCATAMTVLVFV